MLRLRAARLRGRLIPRPARRRLRRPDDQQRLAVIEREPSLPLRVAEALALIQRRFQRRQLVDEVRMYFSDARDGANLVRIRARHSAYEMHDEVAAGDIKVELFERRQTVRLEVLLDLHLDVVPGEVVAQRIAIVAKLGRHGRNEDRHGHRRSPRGGT